MSGDKKDYSGIAWDGVGLGAGQLPIRPEKRIIPTPVPTIEFLNPRVTKEQTAFSWRNLFSPPATDPVTKGYKAEGTSIRDSSSTGDYFLSRAADTFTDYITIRVNGRKQGEDKLPMTFRFLINPHTVNVSRNQIDSQSMTRAGWQLGFWGDDTVEIRLEGVTPGQYFTLGLTNYWGEHSLSYNNFLAFQTLFENNGYWFEGEDIDNSTLASDLIRRRIRFHSDVELRVGNFIWKGCFTDLEVTEDAEKPYQLSFSATFMAWKERFTESSPWRNSIRNDVYRGHAFEAVEAMLARQAAKKAADEAAKAAEAKAKNDAILNLGQGPLSQEAADKILNPPAVATTPTPSGIGSLMSTGIPSVPVPKFPW